MKRFVVTNLKVCFQNGMKFADLATAEKMFNCQGMIPSDIRLGSFCFKFKNAQVSQNGTITGYFEFVMY